MKKKKKDRRMDEEGKKRQTARRSADGKSNKRISGCAQLGSGPGQNRKQPRHRLRRLEKVGWGGLGLAGLAGDGLLWGGFSGPLRYLPYLVAWWGFSSASGSFPPERRWSAKSMGLRQPLKPACSPLYLSVALPVAWSPRNPPSSRSLPSGPVPS